MPTGLSARQREVLSLIKDGLCNREIAERLGKTEGSVEYVVVQIRRRLGVPRHASLPGRPRVRNR